MNMRFKEYAKNIVIGVIGLVAVLLFLSFGVSSVKTMPEYAIVIVDTENGVYYAPPYLEEVWAGNKDLAQEAERKILDGTLVKLTANEARSKYKIDSTSRDKGYFTEDGRNLVFSFLESIGLLPKQKSRWNADGSWNY